MTTRLLRPVFLLSLVACAPKPVTTAGSDNPSATAPRPLHVVMQQHFVYVDDLQKAVISGDLGQAKASAQWIMDNHVEGLNEMWRPHINELESAASVVIEAPDLAQASLGAAQVAGACGSCHAAHGLDLNLSAPPYVEGSDTKAHMKRHQWATDRMWDAVVGNSDSSWFEAAKALEDAPLHLDDGSAESDLMEVLETVAGVVHSIGRRSKDMKDRPSRVRALGELLSTCAACHKSLGIAPENR